MIRRTIKEHLDKEKRLRPQGIKVLSLFFISELRIMRSYDTEGNLLPGPYASIFEQEYTALARRPEYNTLFKGGGHYHFSDRGSQRLLLD